MGPLGTVAVLLLTTSFSSMVRLSHGQGCPMVAGYDFYRLQEVAGALTLTTNTATTPPASLATTCNKTPRCNAFTTSGQLQIVPMVPVFSLLDGSAADTLGCDGIYVARKTLSGLDLPPGLNVDELNKNGAKKLMDMQATAAAAKKVSKKLSEWKMDPRRAYQLSSLDISRAFKESKTPLAQSSESLGSYSYGACLAAIAYPVWDSRTFGAANFVSPVKDQQSCGSCVAFAATAAAESAVAAANATAAASIDLSEQWLFFCNGRFYPSCNTGWYGIQAASVITSQGMRYEANYPYAATPSCSLVSPPERTTPGNFSRYTYTDLNLAKEHIRKHGSVMTYFAVYNDFFSWNAASPPYSYNGYSSLAGYHQVLCVGYNDTGSFWIAKNSWGTGWGDKGFFRISYTAGVGFMSGYSDSIIGLVWTPPAAPSPNPPSPPPPSPEPPSPPPPSPSPPPPSPQPPSTPPPPTPPPSSPAPSPSIPPSPPPRPLACGDGLCDLDETCSNCPEDCGACPSPPPSSPEPSPVPPSPEPPSPEPPTPSPEPPSPPPPSPSPNPPPPPGCGDQLCSADETCATCPTDCGECAVCGDGVCGGGETCSTCLSDCGYLQPNGTRTCCGDGVCDPTAGETCASCKADCGVCRTCNSNGICEPALGERCLAGKNGCADCGSCSGNICGDGKCTSSKKGYTETCATCPQDCGGCTDTQFCGDGLCTTFPRNENLSCSRDCKQSKFNRPRPGIPEVAPSPSPPKPSPSPPKSKPSPSPPKKKARRSMA